MAKSSNANITIMSRTESRKIDKRLRGFRRMGLGSGQIGRVIEFRVAVGWRRGTREGFHG